MTLEEQSLRQLLASTYGQHCGRAIMESIQNGDPLAITMVDGSVLALATVEDARSALQRHFNWTHSMDFGQ